MSAETTAHDLALAAVDEAFGEYIKNLFRTFASSMVVDVEGTVYRHSTIVPAASLKVADATRTALRKAITEGLPCDPTKT